MRAAKEFARECQRVRARRKALTRNQLHVFLQRYIITLCPLAVTAAGAVLVPGLVSLLLLAIVSGLTQNAFAILMHEGSHAFFHPRRTTNDLLANLLVCLPIFNTVEGYRAAHFEHHRLCCDEADPYYGLYGPYDSKRQVLSGFLMDLAGVTAVRTFLRRYAHSGRDHASGHAWYVLPGFVAVHGLIFLLFYGITGQWWAYPLLWVVPLMTIPIAINRIRTFVEHHPGPDGSEANRATIPSFAEYLAIAPYGYAFHFEHHLMPEIPYYQLSWAHSALRSEGVEFRSEHLAIGYAKSFARLFAGLR